LTQQLTIRSAGQQEIPEVRRILDAANRFTRDVLSPPAYDRYRAMVVDVEGRLPHSELLVAERGGRLVGTATLFPHAGDEGWGLSDRVAGIRAMAVHPDAQRGGVGAALLAACIERARAFEVEAVTLHTAAYLHAAIRLYERCGFRRDPAHDRSAAELVGLSDETWDEVALAYRLDLT
jgi:GNAT superfamily N-acetyltransferase